MRRLIVSSLLTADGINGDPQWASEYFDEQSTAESLQALLRSDAMLMGRGTYEYFAPRWSTPEGPYLSRINEMPKYVFSSTLQSADWNSSIVISGDPSRKPTASREMATGILMLYGYGQLAQTLLEGGLVDELKLKISPVMLGVGEPLFRAGRRVNLELLSALQGGNGVITLSYASESVRSSGAPS